jgi:enterochelin esterase-like enzyme
MEPLDAGGTADALKQYRTIFVGVGDWDAPRLHDSMKAAPDGLRERGIPATAYSTPGGHTWSVWQRCLWEFGHDLKARGWARA